MKFKSIKVYPLLVTILILTSLVLFIFDSNNEFIYGPKINETSDNNEDLLLIATTLKNSRGNSGDYLADVILGKRSFEEISARKVVDNRVHRPGGITVFDSDNNGKREIYIWDSANNRILIADYDTCSENLNNCRGFAVLGQPSLTDYGACNGDSSGSLYPNRVPASSTSLCGASEFTGTQLEAKTHTSLIFDSQNRLWVVDVFNNRVLRYSTPLVSGSSADYVIGQDNFSGNLCNKGGQPSDTSLCFDDKEIGALAFDSIGNLWVADSKNNRVLMFPLLTDGNIGKRASIVLGQNNFDENSEGNNNKFTVPTSLSFDNQDNLYIADPENNRIAFTRKVVDLSYPDTIGTTPTYLPVETFITLDVAPAYSILFDREKNALWVGEIGNNMFLIDSEKNVLSYFKVPADYRGQMSKTIDPNGHSTFFIANYWGEIFRFKTQDNISFERLPRILGDDYNQTSNDRLEQGGWGSVAITTDRIYLTDGRLVYWDISYDSSNKPVISSGKAMSGFLGTNTFTEIRQPLYYAVVSDLSQNIYSAKKNAIEVFKASSLVGDINGKQADIVIKDNLKTLEGDTIILNDIVDIAVSSDSKYLWVSEPNNNRVLRIRDPLLDSRRVDVILGQTEANNNPENPTPENQFNKCNRGLVLAPNQDGNANPTLNMLCLPGFIELDTRNNLYVNDHMIETAGNWRMLMFSKNVFEAHFSKVATQNSTLFAPDATKELPRAGEPDAPSSTFETLSTNKGLIDPSRTANAKFKPGFNSLNVMVVGNNPYFGRRFPEIFLYPDKYNASDKDSIEYSIPDLTVSDYVGWVTDVSFDKFDNMYIYDANRGRLLIYYKPTFNVINTETEALCENLDGNLDGLINIKDFSNLSSKLNKKCVDKSYSFKGCGPLDTNLNKTIDNKDFNNFSSLYGTKCPIDNSEYVFCGDLDGNGDGYITIADWSIGTLKLNKKCLDPKYTSTSTCGSMDGYKNGVITTIDFLNLIKYFGQKCTTK